MPDPDVSRIKLIRTGSRHLAVLCHLLSPLRSLRRPDVSSSISFPRPSGPSLPLCLPGKRFPSPPVRCLEPNPWKATCADRKTTERGLGIQSIRQEATLV